MNTVHPKRHLRLGIWLAMACWLIPVGAGIVMAQSNPSSSPDVAREEPFVQALRGAASNIQMDRDTGLVRLVRLSRPVVGNHHLEMVSHFQAIRYLAVVTRNVDDEGLRHLVRLNDLEVLFLSDSGATDATLATIATLPKLERLYLDRTAVTDEGIHAISRLKLKTLSLNDVAVGDLAARTIGQLTTLEELSLQDSRISDEALRHLAGLSELTLLQLDGCPLEGEGLAHLENLPKLRTLSLGNVTLSAAGLKALSRLSGLKHVVLWNAKLPDGGLVELQTAQPKVHYAANQRSNAWRRFVNRRPLARAQGEVKAEAVTLAQIAPPIKDRIGDATPDFQQHVLPLLGRLGCNGRNCHGSFQGRGGFRLSMFGYDFESDLKAMKEGDSPRLSVDSPEESLLLYKPTHGDEHGGGQRLEVGSWQYRLLHQWISMGAKGTSLPKKLLRLEVAPNEILFSEVGQTESLRTTAVWADGRREDVTALTRFQSNDEVVAKVDRDGTVHCLAPGESHIIAFYDNGVTPTQVMLPISEKVGEHFPDLPASTRADELILEKLSKLGIVPSTRCTDEEFLRRVSLDIAGTLPTAEQVRAFVADDAPDKRSKAIQQWLESPAYAQWWTVWLSDLTGSNAQYLGSTDMNTPAAQQWNAWLHRRVADNVGWDRIAAGILLATSREDGQTYESYVARQSEYLKRGGTADYTSLENPMHYYWFRSNNQQPVDRALSFGYVFLGVRLQCAQCHKHPFDQWSQEDFQQFAEFFTRIKTGIAPDAADAQRQLKTKLGVPLRLNTAALRRQMYLRVAAEGLPIPWNEVWIEPGGKPQTAKLLGAQRLNLHEFEDPREPLVSWLLAHDNPYFARAMVNRIWAHYFGVGIVDPPDDLNQANPPSNAALLDYLSAEFVRHGYDLKWLHRTICETDAYQRSWRTNETNAGDIRNFSRAMIRRLPAEATIDAILQATANDAGNQQWRDNVTSRKIAQHPRSIQARGIDYSLLIFGKPLRTTNCDCERQNQPTLLQSLYVRNDQELLEWLQRSDGWLQQLAKELKQPLSSDTVQAAAQSPSANAQPGEVAADRIASLVTAAYYRTLSRPPSESEELDALNHIQSTENVVEGLRDLMWALVNTQEFLTNH